MMAWISPWFTVRSRPLRICRPSISALSPRISRSAVIRYLLACLVRPSSAHASLERDRDQLLRFHRELHRELLQHVLDEAVDDEADCLLLAEAALDAVEQHVLGD